MVDPSQGDQSNDHAVQTLADEEKRKKKLASGKKSRVKKQLKIEATETELETIKDKNIELEKYNAYLEGRLDQVREDLEETREKTRQLLLKIGGQTYMLNMVEEQLTGNRRELPVLHVDDNLLDNTSIDDQINDHTVEPSADQGRKTKKQLSDEKSLNKKKQKIKATETELKKIKAKHLALDKRSSYLTGQLDELKKDLKQAKETNWQVLQMVARQNILTNELQHLTRNSGGLRVVAHENQMGNSGGSPVLVHENQTVNSGGLPVIGHEEPVLTVDDFLNIDYGEMPAMKQQ